MSVTRLDMRWIKRFETKDVYLECRDNKDWINDSYSAHEGKVMDLSLCGGQFKFLTMMGFPESESLWHLKIIQPKLGKDILARGYIRWISHEPKPYTKVGMLIQPKEIEDAKLLMLLERKSNLRYM